MSNDKTTDLMEEVFATRQDWLLKAVALRGGQILRFNPEDLAPKDVLAALVAQEGVRRFVVVPHGSVIFVQRVRHG